MRRVVLVALAVLAVLFLAWVFLGRVTSEAGAATHPEAAGKHRTAHTAAPCWCASAFASRVYTSSDYVDVVHNQMKAVGMTSQDHRQKTTDGVKRWWQDPGFTSWQAAWCRDNPRACKAAAACIAAAAVVVADSAPNGMTVDEWRKAANACAGAALVVWTFG